MKILVIGCGSIGRRHIRLLKEMGVEVVGYDPNRNLAGEVNRLGAKFSDNWDFLFNHDPLMWEGAIVATPNHLHVNPAVECLQHRIPVLVEKPISHRCEEAHMIMAAAERDLETLEEINVPLLVGYNMRHHPGPQAVKQHIDSGTLGTIRHASVWCSSYLPDWRPGTDYRTGYAAKKEMGGGVLLDCSHELDLANWWCDKPVSVMAMVRNTGALDGLETEDVADLLVECESGVQVSVHLDYLGRDHRRGAVVVGDKGTLTYTFPHAEPQLNMIEDAPVDPRLAPILEMRKWVAAVGAASRAVGSVDRNVMYRNQLEHFLRVVKGEETPLVTGTDGLRAVQLVEAAKESAKTGRVIVCQNRNQQ